MICAPSEDSAHSWHSPSLIKVFAVRPKGSWGPNVSFRWQQRLWSDWADAQADLSLRWTYRLFCWFWHAAAHIALTKMSCSKNCTHRHYHLLVIVIIIYIIHQFCDTLTVRASWDRGKSLHQASLGWEYEYAVPIRISMSMVVSMCMQKFHYSHQKI